MRTAGDGRGRTRIHTGAHDSTVTRLSTPLSRKTTTTENTEGCILFSGSENELIEVKSKKRQDELAVPRFQENPDAVSSSSGLNSTLAAGTKTAMSAARSSSFG